MKYVCPAVTVGVTTEPCLKLFGVPSETAQFCVSSLHATCVPVQEPPRTYRMVSNVVAVPQVRIVAIPDLDGVHWKTFSGDVPLFAQVPARLLVPLVVPLKLPPSAWMTVGA